MSEKPSVPTLVLVDGHYFAYRYFFGMPALTGPGGRPTGVTYCFAEEFRKLRANSEITHLALVLDPHGETWRERIFPEYKAHRDPMPEDLRAQIPDIIRLAQSCKVPVLQVPDFEADDVLVSLARTAASQGFRVRIFSRDKDVDQALSDLVSTYDPVKDRLRGPAELLEEKGIRPDQVVDWLSMVGDSADNILGVEGIGPVKATQLLQKYGNLDTILTKTDEFTPKMRERVLAFVPRHELVKRLITIPDVPDLPDPSTLTKETELSDSARTLFEELGFSIARHFQEPAHLHPASTDSDYRILTPSDLPAYLEALRQAGRFAIDTETTGLDPLTAELVGISFAFGHPHAKSAAYLPIQGTQWPQVMPWSQAKPLLTPLLTDPSIKKCGQNVKYDTRIFAQHGIQVAGIDGDAMLASWLLDPARESHGLDALTRLFLREEKIKTAEVIPIGGTMADAPVKTIAKYACEDAQCTWRLIERLEAELERKKLLTVYRTQEVPVALLLASMEHKGMGISPIILAQKKQHLTDYLTATLEQIRRIAGANFNPASPKQVADVLFNRLGLPVLQKTKTGPSTDASVLYALRHDHPLPDLILQHRGLSKLLGTYVEGLTLAVHPKTGRIHTSLRQTGTETGRLSSENPNLQNIPKRGELGRELRAAFTAAPGRVLLAADYSQIELRMLAHFSQDPALLTAFREGRDVHRFTAALVNGVPEDQVTSAQRDAAKTVNFGILYGQGAFGLAQQLGISRTQAQDFITGYFDRFPSIRDYIESVVAQATADGFVTTLLGRHRLVPQLTSANRNEVQAGRRIALNSTIQGSAADLIKQAMIRLSTSLPTGADLILQIHDELIVESDESVVDSAAKVLENAMTQAATLSIPLPVSVRKGRDWLEIS